MLMFMLGASIGACLGVLAMGICRHSNNDATGDRDDGPAVRPHMV